MSESETVSSTPPVPPPVRRTASKPVRRRRPSQSTTTKAPAASRHPRAAARKRPASRRGRLPVRKELSAGGVVARQEKGEWLVGLLQTEHKRGKVWVLPKGHVELEMNEGVSSAAKREVQEEAGVSDLSVKDQLGVTRFTFQAEDAVVHKTVHYFLMITQQKKLTPQAEEGLLDAQWVPINEAIEQLEYDTDQDIVGKAREKLTGEKWRQRTPKRNAHTRRPRKRSRNGRATRIHL